MYEVICPACGALLEAGCEGDLVQSAKEHTLSAHRYDIPPEHVREAMYEVDAEGNPLGEKR